MKVAAPHYLLFSESCRKNVQGEWRFVLQSLDGSEQMEAADAEPNARGERLELLAVVRGLEALEQPSRVTLVTPSKYVNRGLSYGMEEWRTNGWQWEHFGEMVPVKNRDLWQRVDRALEFHELECRTWRFDLPHLPAETPADAEQPARAIRRPKSAPTENRPTNRPRGAAMAVLRGAGEVVNSSAAHGGPPLVERSLRGDAAPRGPMRHAAVAAAVVPIIPRWRGFPRAKAPARVAIFLLDVKRLRLDNCEVLPDDDADDRGTGEDWSFVRGAAREPL